MSSTVCIYIALLWLSIALRPTKNIAPNSGLIRQTQNIEPVFSLRP